jgi:hypothetical protein
MDRKSDALTVALTGQLPAILIIATILAFIASYLLLRLYRRRVIKSMHRRSSSALLETKGYLPPEPEHKPHDAPLSFEFIGRLSGASRSAGDKLFRLARRRRWLNAVVHTLAGACFAATMTAAFLYAGKMELLPLRFSFITWVNCWPIMITIGLIVGPSQRSRILGLAGYFALGAMVGTMLLKKIPGLPVGQLLYLWLEFNAVPTLLLTIFLNRRIRALGPLLLVFMIVSVAGAILAPNWLNHYPKFQQSVVGFSISIGLGAWATLIGLHAIGFFAAALIGWLLLELLRQLYVSKVISEQSITVDAMWLLFGIVNSIGLVFEGYRWIASGFVAFAVYKLAGGVLFGMSGISRRAGLQGRRLLLLRVFALGKRSEQLYDTLGKSWRNVGSIQMIAGPDLATSTIEPHEFLDFVSGRLDRRFIDNGPTLDLRINQMDLMPDRQGRFRVTEFFCHDDTWKMTLARLADDSDAVLMDLRGFSQANAGCVFEIHEIFNIVPLDHAVFAIDRSTDQEFMRQIMAQAWRQMKDRSPNRNLAAGKVALVQLSGQDGGIQDLLYAICGAASVPEPLPA